MALEAHPGVMNRYGKDPKIVKYMIDLQYPHKPPPTFVRKGLEIPPPPIFAITRRVKLIFRVGLLSTMMVFRLKTALLTP